MELKLIVIGGKHPGQEISVPGPNFVIGRAEECQLRPRSNAVSRRHCEIVLEPGRAVVRDLGSSNGTKVNGEEVKGDRELKAGDRLTVGPLEFEVQLVVTVGGKKKPKVHSVQEAAARTVREAAGEEMDITGWLEDEEDEEEPLPGIGGAQQPTTAQETVRDEPVSDSPPKKTKPATSRDAAAELLNKWGL